MGIADDVAHLRAEHVPLGPELTEAQPPACSTCGGDEPWPCAVIRVCDLLVSAANGIQGVVNELESVGRPDALRRQARRRLATRLYRAINPPPPTPAKEQP